MRVLNRGHQFKTRIYIQARRKRCGMAEVAAPKICSEREREKEEKGGKKEKRGEIKERERGKKGREE